MIVRIIIHVYNTVNQEIYILAVNDSYDNIMVRGHTHENLSHKSSITMHICGIRVSMRQ